MKYMMFVCTDTEPGDDQTGIPDIEQWVADNDGNGRRLEGSVLGPASSATTVRVRGGELLVTDGPFAETKEIICGYDMLECDSLEEAVQVASAHPVAGFGKIEVRAVWTL